MNRMGKAGLALLVVFCVSNPARGAESSTIALRDGSTIHGEVISLRDGVYTIRSTTLGTIGVRQADVRSVTNDPGSPAPAPAIAPAQVDALSERMAADPQIMDAVTALQDAPEIKAVLDDSELMDALQNGDIETLLSNPKMLRLATDPRVQDITKKLSH